MRLIMVIIHLFIIDLNENIYSISFTEKPQ